MNLLEVYPRYDLELVKGKGCHVWDKKGKQYLDLYGGHAVISIGHSHPHYIDRIQTQLKELAFYSNSVQTSVQDAMAYKLGELSGCKEYSLFLCNSGAEANENALKVASFHTMKKKVIVFEHGFHGRTSLAVEATDNEKIQAPINHTGNFIRLPWNDEEALESNMDESIGAVLIEGIQGISGVHVPSSSFLKKIEKLSNKFGAVFIADEIQSGYGRTGQFFAHQFADVKPDIITTAKGMGNGFPIAGVLISPDIQSRLGMLGSTFGGNHLACAAGLAVLEVLENESMIENAAQIGSFLTNELKEVEGVIEVRGRGLMIGVSLDYPAKNLRDRLVFDYGVFTGSSTDPNTLRILPPLSLCQEQAEQFLSKFKQAIHESFSIHT